MRFLIFSFLPFFWIACVSGFSSEQTGISLANGYDDSAGDNVACYIVSTPTATFYLEKKGGGLSSMLDIDGVDWLGFHNEEGSGWKGEYRGFPNSIHRQDGNYFHALNAGTEVSSSIIEIESVDHIRIVFTSGNGKWKGQWDFYVDRCDFTMTKVSDGYKYWILYEGVPGGAMDEADFWFSSGNKKTHMIDEKQLGDLPSPEWIAFGDKNSSRMIYLLNHKDDEHPDNYFNRPYMTVFGFGRSDKGKFLETSKTFSIGFIESIRYEEVEDSINKVLP